MIACGSNAYLKIMPNVAGMYFMRIINRISPPNMNIAAMIGTIFSVTEASLLVPPRKINPQSITRTTPTVQPGTPNAVLNVAPMEFDCTIQPKKPSASVIATAKKPARNLPKPPLNAVLI